MATTTTTTQTSTSSSSSSSAQEFSILTRVYSIPLIASSLLSIDETLAGSPYTRSTYSTAKGLSSSAYKYVEPLQARLPVATIDGYANKVMDVMEARYPYPFKAKPEEVKQSASDFVRVRKDSANKTIDERVRTPAYNVAQGIDQRFAPIVDYLEVAVDRFSPDSEDGPRSLTSESQYQYQRALAISNRLKDNVYLYSNDQIKHLHAQNAIVQRATDTAQSIQLLAQSSLSQAQNRITSLSESMLVELQKLQASTAASASQIQTQLSPPQLQKSYQELSTSLAATVNEFGDILRKKDTPIQEKVMLIANQVRDRVTPLLNRVRDVVAGRKLTQNGNGHAKQE